MTASPALKDRRVLSAHKGKKGRRGQPAHQGKTGRRDLLEPPARTARKGRWVQWDQLANRARTATVVRPGHRDYPAFGDR